jgi:putative DNA primase/helicase
MMELAAAEMDVSLSEFDVNPTAINTPNGIVDLRTKELLPHAPERLHLLRTYADYNPSAKCPRWLRFLNEVFEEDQTLIDWLQIAAGYSIMGLTAEHCFFLCHGNGRNGKGIFLETIGYVLGNRQDGYSQTTRFETFLQTEQSNVRVLEGIGRLRAKRFIIASETQDNTRLNEALVKSLTGGDTLVGAKLHSGMFSFEPVHTIWLACNHLPIIRDASLAMWERVRTIPFGRMFLAEDQEKDLKERMKLEADGILNWLVEGAFKYLKDGLPKQPEICREATQAYRDQTDKLSIFIRECIEPDNSFILPLEDAYKSYKEWQFRTSSSGELIGYNDFGKSISERGIQKKRRNIGNVLVGVKLKA